MRAPRTSVAYVWGSTPDERTMPFPCDRYLTIADDVFYRALDVDAPPPVVFRWLCQLKVAPYSYDWIDNFGRPSPRHLIPGLEDLALGQRCMTFFELVEFEANRHLTVRAMSSAATALTGELVASYVVLPRSRSRSRLVVKFLVRYPRGPLGWLERWLLPWGDLVMMRKQLLNLKGLAEAHVHAGGAPDVGSRGALH